ncbi:MAG TPA: penicillin acylase family protein [Steroidobacteraceae bacterium]|nr:penicillin acylase family protein [Steroidobacteraceae bacterium]
MILLRRDQRSQGGLDIRTGRFIGCIAALLAASALPAASALRAAPRDGAAPGAMPPASTSGEAAAWRREAAAVTIVRDPWGIAHVHGRSDADAVFGAMYAQAEDDFHRIEHNYLLALGRLAEAEGESATYSDLRQRLFIDPEDLKRQYRGSPAWLKALMNAWADGLNFYLAVHPQVKPAVITHFEPWMALSFTEGSIGGDIGSVDLPSLARFYPTSERAPASEPASVPEPAPEPSAPGGSNGFAIAPALSASGHALLWINPHTSFYFRSELQMSSDEGLDAYGAATWGQFFIYQGFNAHNGWMHTSYGGDAIDEYAESMVDSPRGRAYRYGRGLRPVTVGRIQLSVKSGNALVMRTFTVYRTHHGPIVRAQDGKWIAVKIFLDPVRALEQSYLRTKTTDYASFRKTQDMRTDTSNNTVYADADGTIAYFHGNFIPKRDARFDFTHPVDGSNPATEWHGPHALDETIMLLNPSNGWIQNTNDWPFSAAGSQSPRREDYPAYMWTRGETPRGIHAVELLEHAHGLTLDSLIALGYDPHLTAFDALIPPLLRAYDRLSGADPRHTALAGPIAALRAWNRRTSADSAATALAIFWGQALIDEKRALARAANETPYDYLLARLTDDERLVALGAAVAQLEHDFGRWRVPWGEINRFQRLTDDIVQPFDDRQPSLPVGFAPGQWGALASFDSTQPRTTRHIFGSKGNSFVAAVEFGPTVRAKALLTGGESGDPASPHFADQALMYCAGRFRDVLFAPADVAASARRRYHPGEP